MLTHSWPAWLTVPIIVEVLTAASCRMMTAQELPFQVPRLRPTVGFSSGPMLECRGDRARGCRRERVGDAAADRQRAGERLGDGIGCRVVTVAGSSPQLVNAIVATDSTATQERMHENSIRCWVGHCI